MQRDENLTNVSLSGRVKAPTERYRERQSRQSDRNTERRESPKCLTQWPREVDANEESAGRERYKRDKQITMPPHNATHNAERRIKTDRNGDRNTEKQIETGRLAASITLHFLVFVGGATLNTHRVKCICTVFAENEL